MGNRCRGFTLLELLVVLVILALGTAVATPAVMKLVSSLEKQNSREAIALYLQKLPVQVMEQGRSYTLPQTSGYVPAREALGAMETQTLNVDLDGLRVWIPEPIDYRINGACTGGTTHWELPGEQKFTFDLNTPLCRPQLRT